MFTKTIRNDRLYIGTFCENYYGRFRDCVHEECVFPESDPIDKLVMCWKIEQDLGRLLELAEYLRNACSNPSGASHVRPDT